ncbi:hypothetical protein GQ42DRAFT_9228 [Ramicandelaber brevisporus]|nr:hypothetical protein GQ42DRAFT_9228 [Ramicandelaber brevisporus]
MRCRNSAPSRRHSVTPSHCHAVPPTLGRKHALHTSHCVHVSICACAYECLN